MNEALGIVIAVMRASSHRFVGRLGRDPEVRYLDSGKCVASVRIAIYRPGAKQGDGQEPDWFKVEVWGEPAQAFGDQCKKGDLVEAIGRVKTSRWTDRTTGEQKVELVVTADHWSLLQSRNPAPAAAPAAASAPAAAPAQHPAYAAAGHQPASPAAPPVWQSSDEIPF